jgi:hypothetical protein
MSKYLPSLLPKRSGIFHSWPNLIFYLLPVTLRKKRLALLQLIRLGVGIL